MYQLKETFDGSDEMKEWDIHVKDDQPVFALHSPKEKVLSCIQCEKVVTFSVNEQKFFAAKDYSKPKRCKSCRELNRLNELTNNLSYSDKLVCCVECKIDFTWSVGEQIFFEKKGLFSRPKRCKGCRKKLTNIPIDNTNTTRPILPEPKKEIHAEILLNIVGNGKKKIIMTSRNIEMLEQKGKVKLGFSKNQNISILYASCPLTQSTLLTLEAASVLTFLPIKK